MGLIDKAKSVISRFFPGIENRLRLSPKLSHETYLRRLSDYLEIPDKSFFKNDESIYNKIEEYKNFYLQKLKNPKTRYSWELGNKDLNDRRLMLVELIKKNFVDEIDNVLDEENLVKKMVMLKKFEIYLNDIKGIYIDALSRLVALSEIKEEGNKKGKNIVDSEIENLSISLITLKQQMNAILFETKAYQDVIKNYNIEDLSFDENQKIDDEYKKLSENVKSFLDVSDIDSLDKDYYTKMALLEKKLEEYFYSHPEYINRYMEEFRKIASYAGNLITTPYLMERYESEKSNPEINLTERIMAIDKQIKIFEKYGRPIDPEFKEEYYRNKIRIIVYDNLNSIDVGIFNEDDEQIRNIYREEIEKRIQIIVKHDLELGYSFYQEDNDDFPSCILKLIKDTIGSFDSDAILLNNYLLSLLFSLDTSLYAGYYLNKWFESKVNREEFLGEELNTKYFDNVPGIVFLPELSIKTICEVLKKQTNFKNKLSKDTKAISSLVDLYSLAKSTHAFTMFGRCNDSVYQVPEGIYQIGESDNSSDYLRALKRETKGNLVKMPSSLKVFKGNNAISNKIAELRFSNGTREIDFDCHQVMYIIIPPSVEDLKIDFKDIKYGSSPPYCYHRTLIFLDYEKSSFLNPKNDKDIAKANNFFNSLPNDLWIELHSINGEKKAIHGRKLIEEWTKEGELKNHILYAREQDIPITDKIVMRKKDDDTSSETENINGLIYRAEI